MSDIKKTLLGLAVMIYGVALAVWVGAAALPISFLAVPPGLLIALVGASIMAGFDPSGGING